LSSSSTISSIAQVNRHSFHLPSTSNHRLQKIVAYHRNMQCLASNFPLLSNQPTTSRSMYDNTFGSGYSNSIDKDAVSSEQHQQHINLFASEELDDDIDWQSIASDDDRYMDELSCNNDEVQPDQHFHKYEKCQSSRSPTTSISPSASSEDEEETGSSHTREHSTLDIAIGGGTISV
jgi:hypothetical protein